jgi:hypothetical protein
MTIGDREYAREDVAAALGRALDVLLRDVRQERRVALGTYHGLRFGLVLNPHFPPEVYLEGVIVRQDRLARDHAGPRAVLNALERLAAAYGADIARTRQDLSIAETQLRDYQARVGRPFDHDAYQADLTGLRNRLRASLAGRGPESDSDPSAVSDPEPTATELVEQIKAVRAAHTVEAAPERLTARRLDAEEPVTARIRRHTASDRAEETATEAERHRRRYAERVGTTPTSASSSWRRAT